MKIDEALVNTRRLGVDTAPFIYFTERRAGYIDKMRAVFRHVLEAKITIMVSTIIVPEILSKPLQEKAEDLIATYRDMLENTQGLVLYPVDTNIAYRAAGLRARHNLKIPDALHIATAIEAGCNAFLTNDLDLRRVTEIQILILDDLEPPTPG